MLSLSHLAIFLFLAPGRVRYLFLDLHSLAPRLGIVSNRGHRTSTTLLLRRSDLRALKTLGQTSVTREHFLLSNTINAKPFWKHCDANLTSFKLPNTQQNHMTNYCILNLKNITNKQKACKQRAKRTCHLLIGWHLWPCCSGLHHCFKISGFMIVSS